MTTSELESKVAEVYRNLCEVSRGELVSAKQFSLQVNFENAGIPMKYTGAFIESMISAGLMEIDGASRWRRYRSTKGSLTIDPAIIVSKMIAIMDSKDKAYKESSKSDLTPPRSRSPKAEIHDPNTRIVTAKYYEMHSKTFFLMKGYPVYGEVIGVRYRGDATSSGSYVYDIYFTNTDGTHEVFTEISHGNLFPSLELLLQSISISVNKLPKFKSIRK